jgi:hypothetical protein
MVGLGGGGLLPKRRPKLSRLVRRFIYDRQKRTPRTLGSISRAGLGDASALSLGPVRVAALREIIVFGRSAAPGELATLK